MSKTLTRQLINGFKAQFKNENVVIPAAIRQEQSSIVFTGLVDPTEQEMMNKDTALSPLATADLFAMPGGMPGAQQPQLPPGTMDSQQGMQPEPQPVNAQPGPQPQPGQTPQPAPPAAEPQQPPQPQETPNPQSLAGHLLLE